MKKLDFIIDFAKLNLKGEMLRDVQDLGQKGLFENYLSRAINEMTNNGGLKGSELRTFYRIQEKLDSAASGCLELEEAEFDLVKRAFTRDETQWPPMQVRALMQYLTNIEKCEHASKPEKDS